VGKNFEEGPERYRIISSGKFKISEFGPRGFGPPPAPEAVDRLKVFSSGWSVRKLQLRYYLQPLLGAPERWLYLIENIGRAAEI
jgi:hypothetical protein